MKNNLIKIAILIIIASAVLFFLSNKKNSNNQTLKVGILQPISHPALEQIRKGIIDELKDHDFIQNKNIEFIVSNAEGNQVNLTTMSQKLVADKPDLLIGIGVLASKNLANNTNNIPIIASAVVNPESIGLVKTNQKPGGNVTAISDVTPVAKQLKFLLEIKPNIKTIGVIYSNGDANSNEQINTLKHELSKLPNISLKEYAISKAVELNQTAEKLASGVDAIYVPTDNLLASTMPVLVKIANKHKVPIFPGADSMVKDGGLATVSITQYDTGRITGKMAYEILSKKNTPANMPVVFYDDGKKMLNLGTAKELNITIPENILNQVKENGVIFE